MTVVNVDLRIPSSGGPVPAGGRLAWQPTQRRVDGTVVILPVRTSVDLPNGTASVTIDPGVYWFQEDTNGGQSAYRIVPDVGPVGYAALAAVDPATLDPESVPEAAWYAYTDTLAATAQTAATAATQARDAATLSQTSAQASASAAALSETNAGASATVASQAATTAAGAQADASESADSAAQSELAASGFATNAGNSATAAATSAAGAESARGSMVIGGAVDAQGHLILTRQAANPADAGYVVGPPITLTITETTTGPDTPGTPGPPGIQGATGAAGGFVLGTDLGTANLDTITTIGMYRQSNGTNATLANNYPLSAIAGSLEVFAGTSTAGLIQRFTTFSGGNNGNGRMMYLRRGDSGVWQPWRAYASQRVDNSSGGRAIYTWDDQGGRDQLVYADSGERDITNLINGTAAAFKIRRYGSMVEIVCVNWQPSANGQAVLQAALPVGWRNSNTHAFWATNNTTSTAVNANLGASASGITLGGNVTTSTYSFFLTFMTIDQWPTSMIGTLVGSIPNL